MCNDVDFAIRSCGHSVGIKDVVTGLVDIMDESILSRRDRVFVLESGILFRSDIEMCFCHLVSIVAVICGSGSPTCEVKCQLTHQFTCTPVTLPSSCIHRK